MARRNIIPLYFQLETTLRRKIVNGELPPGGALPSEDTLATDFKVSRITVRQALGRLEEDGLIIRQRGRGTFVSADPPLVDSSKFSGSMEDMVAMGIKTRVRVLHMETLIPPERVRLSLELPPQSRVVRIEKIRLVEKSTFSYVVNYLPEKYGAGIQSADLSREPLLVILEKQGIKADQAVQTIEATTADSETAKLLDIFVGSPLLKVERTVYDPGGRPLEHVSVLYRSDKYRFKVKLKREQSAYSANWQRAVEPQAENI